MAELKDERIWKMLDIFAEKAPGDMPDTTTLAITLQSEGVVYVIGISGPDKMSSHDIYGALRASIGAMSRALQDGFINLMPGLRRADPSEFENPTGGKPS